MAEFDFSTLITDRSSGDVTALQSLIGKIQAGTATDDELAEWNAAALKGAYNYTDLNRVTACMDYLNEVLTGYGYLTGYAPVAVPHDDDMLDAYTWYEADKPKPELFNAYLANAAALRGTLVLPPDTAETPADGEGLTLAEANAIESILNTINEVIQNMVAGWIYYSGDLYCGEI